MKKFLLLVFVLFFLPLVLAGSVTRSFSSANVKVGEEAEVSINVNTELEDEVYAIQENLPFDIQVVDAGLGTLASNNLRWIEYSNVESIIYKYKIKALNSGTYIFDGEYAFNNQGLKSITGDTILIVTGADGSIGSSGSNGASGATTCTPSWTCSSWSECINDEKTRICSDENNCEAVRNKPVEKMLCSETGQEKEQEIPEEKNIFNSFILILIIVIIAIIILILKRRKNL